MKQANKKVVSVFAAAITFISLTTCPLQAQKAETDANFAIIKKGLNSEEIIKKAAQVTPSKKQYNWQKMEMTGFIHFGINTFDEVEWGQKAIDISKFNPEKLDVKQWVKTFKDAGIKLMILTAKHHDGFCLWPSKYTDLNISKTPFRNGKGDVVAELSKACKEAGIKFGIYLSPWDMHEKSYGTPAYNEHFRNQLTELLTNYGEISEVWFDGACGEGPNGKKQVYDWQSYYKLIRKLQPNAVIAVSGPDVRWVGTESGYGRQTEWSVLPGNSSSEEEVAANSQQKSLDGAFTPRDLMNEDLGSRSKIMNTSALIWYPAEIDVSIRPGWFYHQDEDNRVKTPNKLVDIYYNSVGLNGVLLLNVPPNKDGLISPEDIKSLKGMRYILDETFKTNLAKNSSIIASSQRKGFDAKNILDNKLDTYWTTKDTISKASIELKLQKEQTFNRAMLQENILKGQRIEKFHLEYFDGKSWIQFAQATTVGYKRLLSFPEVKASRIKIVIDQCRTNPTLSSFGLFMAPPEISFSKDEVSFGDTVSFSINCDTKEAKIYYTTDGGLPTERSSEYKGTPVQLNNTTTVTAIAIGADGKKSIPITANFNKALYKIEYKTKLDERYPGTGVYNIVDGVKGSNDFKDGKWQGFEGKDVEAIIDLGKKQELKKLSWRFLQSLKSYIFLPKSVEFSVSDDGQNFTPIKTVVNEEPDNKDRKPFVKSFDFSPKNTSARYIYVKAVNIGAIPKWHEGAGEKAWVFTDEFIVE